MVKIILITGVFCLLFNDYAQAMPTIVQNQKQKTNPSKNPEKDPNQKTDLNKKKETVAFDSSYGIDDFDCVVHIEQYPYIDPIAGAKKGLSGNKWFFTTSLFDKEKCVAHIAFPAALDVSDKNLAAYRPIILMFIPRATKGNVVGWEREIVTIENGALYKYLLWAKKDKKTGVIRIFSNFGKRIPLYQGKEIIDSTTVVADTQGNVFFRTKKDNLFLWNASQEMLLPTRNIGSAIRPVMPIAPIERNNDVFVITAAEKNLLIPVGMKAQIMDPIKINLDAIKLPFKNFGTVKRPLSTIEYQQMIDDDFFMPGLLLALNDLLQKKQIIQIQPVAPDYKQAELNKVVDQQAAQYIKNIVDFSSIKKIAHEKCALPVPQKWLIKEEVMRIITALSVGNPSAGGVKTFYAPRAIVPGQGRTISFTHHGKTGVWQGQYVVSWGLYRYLKNALRSGVIDNPAYWDIYEKEVVELLKKVIREHGNMIMTKYPEKLQHVFKKFLTIPNQSSWTAWFEKENRIVDFELLFDYFCFLTPSDYMALLSRLGITSSFELFRIDAIIKAYKASVLCGLTM